MYRIIVRIEVVTPPRVTTALHRHSDPVPELVIEAKDASLLGVVDKALRHLHTERDSLAFASVMMTSTPQDADDDIEDED